MRWNSFPPLEVKPKLTSGAPAWSVDCCGLVMSLPNSATCSCSTKYCALGLLQLMGLLKLDGTACSTTVPCWIANTLPCEALTPCGRPEYRSWTVVSGPDR